MRAWRPGLRRHGTWTRLQTVHRIFATGLISALAVGSAAAEPEADPEPDPQRLAEAPPGDAASGIAVARAESDHRFVNAILAPTRLVARFLFTAPRYAAGEIDDYLEGRSPDVGARTAKRGGWRFGAIADAETSLGASLGLRVGYDLPHATAVDIYGGMFGVRGQSGGVRAQAGPYTSLRLRPTLTVDAGRELARVFAGVGEQGPRTGYHERRIAAVAGLSARLGPLQLVGTGGLDRTKNDDDDDGPAVADNYDPSMLVGFAETERAGTGELAVIYDNRRRTHPWVSTATRSTGYYLRAAAAHTRGDASRTGSFATTRGTLEARRLFDLFHGDRVLSIAVRGEAVTGEDLPFDRLPSLGGRERLRAFARDELRDRSAAYAELDYEWALGADSRAYVFVETGGVAPRPSAFSASELELCYGGGIRLLTDRTTALRAQLAGSADGHFGFYLQLGVP
jgi:hypothetical protein